MQSVVVIVQQRPVRIITAWTDAVVTMVPDSKEGQAAVDLAVLIGATPSLIASVTMTSKRQPIL
jgi:hypothetical protein